MLKVKKILFPLVFNEPARHLAQQVVWLARRFQAEVVLLHVVEPFVYPSAVLEGGDEITAWNLQAGVAQQAQRDLDEALVQELDGIAVTRILSTGSPAHEIVTSAQDLNVDLIAMATHGEGAFYRFLLGSVTAKVLHESRCAVWTGAHLEEAPAGEFSIRRILCSVELGPHSRHTVARAAEMATAIDATLTLVHITPSTEFYSPGGYQVDPGWRETLTGIAEKEIADLQQEVGTHAEVVIESGNVPERLNRVAAKTKADVLIVGRMPGRSHLGDNGEGYGIIRAAHVPVLSV